MILIEVKVQQHLVQLYPHQTIQYHLYQDLVHTPFLIKISAVMKHVVPVGVADAGVDQVGVVTAVRVLFVTVE